MGVNTPRAANAITFSYFSKNYLGTVWCVLSMITLNCCCHGKQSLSDEIFRNWNFPVFNEQKVTYGSIPCLDCFMHLSMLSPRGGGGPRAYVGHLTSIVFPTLGNLTKNLGPRVGMFAFFARRNGTKSHRPVCTSVSRSSWN